MNQQLKYSKSAVVRGFITNMDYGNNTHLNAQNPFNFNFAPDNRPISQQTIDSIDNQKDILFGLANNCRCNEVPIFTNEPKFLSREGCGCGRPNCLCRTQRYRGVTEPIQISCSRGQVKCANKNVCYDPNGVFAKDPCGDIGDEFDELLPTPTPTPKTCPAGTHMGGNGDCQMDNDAPIHSTPPPPPSTFPNVSDLTQPPTKRDDTLIKSILIGGGVLILLNLFK